MRGYNVDLLGEKDRQLPVGRTGPLFLEKTIRKRRCRQLSTALGEATGSLVYPMAEKCLEQAHDRLLPMLTGSADNLSIVLCRFKGEVGRTKAVLMLRRNRKYRRDASGQDGCLGFVPGPSPCAEGAHVPIACPMI